MGFRQVVRDPPGVFTSVRQDVTNLDDLSFGFELVVDVSDAGSELGEDVGLTRFGQ